MIRAIIFDLDNSVIDFLSFKVETAKAAASAMVKQGLPISEVSAYGKIFSIYEKEGLDYQKTFHDVIAPFNLPPDDSERIQQSAIAAYLRRKFEVLRPFTNVRSTLAKVPFSIKKIGISNSPRNKVWQRLVLTSLESDFDLVLSKDDSPDLKLRLGLSLGRYGFTGDCVLFVSADQKALLVASQMNIQTYFAKYGSLNKSISQKTTHSLDSIDQILNFIF